MKTKYSALIFAFLTLSSCKTTISNQTEPPEAELPQLTFAIIGDYGSRQIGEDEVAQMVKSAIFLSSKIILPGSYSVFSHSA